MSNQNFLDIDQYNELEKIMSRIRKDNKLTLDIIKRQDKNKVLFFKNIAFNRSEIKLGEFELEELISKKFLKYLSKKDGTLTFTFKTIVIFDYGLKSYDLNVGSFLNDLNDVFFENILKLSEEPLSTRDKAIIITLLGLGAVSAEHSLVVDDGTQEHVKAAVDEAVNYLASLGENYKDRSFHELWNKKIIGESKVRAEFRRIDKLPKGTEGIYVGAKSGHYLDILNDKELLNEKKLEYLFIRIFGTPLNFKEKKSLIETLDKLQNYDFKIFKNNPKYNILKIRNDIKRLIESKI